MPTVVLNPEKDSLLMQEEIFGPILPVVPYKTFQDALDYINAKDKPLVIYFFGQHNG